MTVVRNRWFSPNRVKYCAPALFAVACTSPPAAPADLSGQWTLTMDPDFKGSRSVVECDLQQQGEEFTIKCGATGLEMKGKVTGSKATWSFAGSGAYPMPQDRVVLTYTGDVDDSGASLTGTWRVTSSVVNESGRFEAKKKQ